MFRLRCLLCGQTFEDASDLEAIRLLNQHTLEQHTGGGSAAPPPVAPPAPPETARGGDTRPPRSG